MLIIDKTIVDIALVVSGVVMITSLLSVQTHLKTQWDAPSAQETTLLTIQEMFSLQNPPASLENQLK